VRHVWVTGAGSGIGQAVAEKFAKDGEAVTLADIDGEKVSSVCDRLVGEGLKCHPVCGNITTRDDVQRMRDDSNSIFGDVNVLINCAGIYPSKLFMDVTQADWDKVFGVNLFGLSNVSQVLAADMIRNRNGWIVNISSCDGKCPGRGNSVYSASKAAVISLTRSMAIELVEYGILVNGIAPGWVGTSNVLANDRWKSAVDAIPLKRIATPEEIADAVFFLCSTNARYIVGEILNVNGGLIMD
jgi:3-oxoacyl-[acyl-carrier protein] reductase